MCKNKTPFSTPHFKSQPGPPSPSSTHSQTQPVPSHKNSTRDHIALQTLVLLCVIKSVCHFPKLQQHMLLQQARGQQETGT